MRYDVFVKDGPLMEPAFVRSVVERPHAIEIVDDLVERDRHWSAHAASEKRFITYSRTREPIACTVDGWELPLHKGRAFLNAMKGADNRSINYRTDAEMLAARDRFLKNNFTVRWALTIREVELHIHEELTGWHATDEPPF